MKVRPVPQEYPPYFSDYIDLVPEGDIRRILKSQNRDTLALLDSLGARASFRYEPEKWSLKEIVGHLSDTERILSYWALRFGRGDETPLPGFEQDDYVACAGFDSRPWGRLVDEFGIIRKATLALFENLDEKAFLRQGTADGKPLSVRAIAFIIAGHELHHVAIIRERYQL